MTTTTTFMKKYKILQKIGEGSFSEVLKCQDRQTGALYAAKRLKKIYEKASEMLESPEVIAMRKISRHPNILYMIESLYDPLPGKVTLIFELMEMSLYDLVQTRKGRMMTEPRVKVFLYQLLKGLEHLHKHGIFHRDIKPENILLKGVIVKLADLGSIRGIYSRPPYTEYISTRWYRSPECLLTTGFYGPKMDVWAIGCVYYELLTLKPLFPGTNEVDQISKIHEVLGTPHARLVAKFRRHKSRNCEYFFPNKGGSGVNNLLPHVTENGRDVLKLMLAYDPENRSNVRRLLDHRYFNDLRDKDSSPRQSSSLIVPNATFREVAQWRNPVHLSYMISERRRKPKASRPRRTNKICDEDTLSKIPRVVASSPNARPNLSNKSSTLKFEKSNNVTAVEASRKKLDRVWRSNNNVCTTRHSVVRMESTDKLPPINKHENRAKLSRESLQSFTSYKKMGLQQVASLSSQRSYGGMINSNSQTQFGQQRISPSCNSFLPQLAMKSNVRSFHRFPIASTGSVSNQNFNVKSLPSNAGLRQAKLATITEQQQTLDIFKQIRTRAKSPQTKSPAKKIAKHEMSTPRDSSLMPIKRLKTNSSRASMKGDKSS